MAQATAESKGNRSVFSSVENRTFVVCDSREEGCNVKFTVYDGLSERNTKYEIIVIFGGLGRDKNSNTVHISLKRTVNNNGVVSAMNSPEGFAVHGDEAKALYADFGHSADSQTIALFDKVIGLTSLNFAKRYKGDVLGYGGARAAMVDTIITTELVLLRQGICNGKFIEPEKQEDMLKNFAEWLRLDTTE
jgi:hypothetical protein